MTDVEVGDTQGLGITPYEYRQTEWLVESNAKLQGYGDGRTLPIEEARQKVNDNHLRLETQLVLKNWSRGPKGELIFRGVQPEVRRALSTEQRESLLDYWCRRYLEIVYETLQYRLQEEGNHGDKQSESGAS
jgi:hypothetical protein